MMVAHLQPKIVARRFCASELAVLLVIGIVLASLLVPAVTRIQERRDGANCQRALQVIGMATSDYVRRHDGNLPMARSTSGWWYESLPADLSPVCGANAGVAPGGELVNYGWNSYLGDVDLAIAAPVRLAAIDRTADILVAGDGTHTGEVTKTGSEPIVWLQKTWHREAQQAVLGPAIHGESLNYLFVDGHVRAVDLLEPRLTANPTLLPDGNFWVERVVSAPGPFFE
jgi:prepilin-type processing-associated H-X9-DG protein